MMIAMSNRNWTVTVLAILAIFLVGGAVWFVDVPSVILFWDSTEKAFSSLSPDENDIAGRVLDTYENPEAGVWVIAQTDTFPNTYRKIVVTDEHGRFVVPDLPQAPYQLWVRGYGLHDSLYTGESGKRARPGAKLTLHVKDADSPRKAARIYPANYWLSLLRVPDKQAFSASFSDGNGIPKSIESKKEWVGEIVNNCMLCHQLGTLPTRQLQGPDRYVRGWKKVSSMYYEANYLNAVDVSHRFANWSRRLEEGTLPPQPPRPEGKERNFVITEWDFGNLFTYNHDVVSAPYHHPTRNANGPVWGTDVSGDTLYKLNPKKHKVMSIPVPTRNGFDTPASEQTWKPLDENDEAWSQKNWARLKQGDLFYIGFGDLGDPAPGGRTGFEGASSNPANPHNPMLGPHDSNKVWLTTQIRREWAKDLPEFCKDDTEIVKNYHHRQLAYYDIDTKSFELIDTCFGTHHLVFDKQGKLWLSGDVHVLGWFNPEKYDPNDPSTLEEAQGWAKYRVDSNGDGKADKHLRAFAYGITTHPNNRSVWVAMPTLPSPGQHTYPGWITRYDPGKGYFEAYQPPSPAHGPRGISIDSDGTVWTALSGSSHLGRFNRDACDHTWGTGGQCKEGWTLWEIPTPDFNNTNNQGSDMHYQIWVDRHNTLGMGKDMIVINGTNSDSLIVFNPESETFTTIRLPYPVGFYTRWVDGRIDDSGAGWKGRGLWITNGMDSMLHSEASQSQIAHIQFRPNPLAH